MKENIRRCAIFGQNVICFKWGFDEDEKQCCRMKLELLQRIMELRQQDVTQFFIACDYGIGLYAAEQINDLRKTDPDLMLFCKLPHEGQATKWAPYLRERYFKMLEDCTHIDCISLRAQPDAQLLAYQRIIDQSDLILTVFDSGASAAGPAEEKALAYALVSRKPVLDLDPYTLAVSRIDKRADK